MVLESAYFHPASVRRTSKQLALKTEASTRFERGGDIGAPPSGLLRAAQLFLNIGATTSTGSVVDVYPVRRRPIELVIRASRIARLLGQPVLSADVPRILTPLGFTVTRATATGWLWFQASASMCRGRRDTHREIGRHYGFDRLPVTFPPLAAAQGAPDPRIARDGLVRKVLTSAGFSESMTFAFIERQAALPFAGDGFEPAAIANPLSEKFAVLRPSLVPGLVDSCAHNRRRGRKDIRLFETGSRFTHSTRFAGSSLDIARDNPEPAEGSRQAAEGRAAAIVWHGAADGPHWSGTTRNVDLFDVKGVVERLCAAFGVAQPEFAPAEFGFLVRGRSAVVRLGDVSLGVLGQLDPAVAGARGLPAAEETYVAEIDLDALAEGARGDDLRVQPLPRFPAIVRDVSILVDEALPAAAVRGLSVRRRPHRSSRLRSSISTQGKGVPDGRILSLGSRSAPPIARDRRRSSGCHRADRGRSAGCARAERR
jgi:phenylalanyl-tRNA synthetase beta chain